MVLIVIISTLANKIMVMKNILLLFLLIISCLSCDTNSAKQKAAAPFSEAGFSDSFVPKGDMPPCSYIDSIKVFYIPAFNNIERVPVARYPFTNGELKVGWTLVDSMAVTVFVDTLCKNNEARHIEVFFEKNIELDSSYLAFNGIKQGCQSQVLPQSIGSRPLGRNNKCKFDYSGFDVVATMKYGSMLYSMPTFSFTAYVISDKGIILEKMSAKFERD